jgi:hypothetical protein
MKLMHRITLVSAIALALLPGMTIGVNAQSAANQGLQSCNTIADPLRRNNCQLAILANQAQIDLVRSWTPRQYELDRKISHIMYIYQVSSGSPVPVIRENVNTMMWRIGAYPQEFQFVADRMQANYSVGISLNQIDRRITRWDRFVQCLGRGSTNCMP